MAKIAVTIEGGEVKAVDRVPSDRYVEVRHYGADRVAPESLSKEEDGRPCQILGLRAPA